MEFVGNIAFLVRQVVHNFMRLKKIDCFYEVFNCILCGEDSGKVLLENSENSRSYI